MNIEIKIDNNNLEINNTKFQKMIFLYNALENGWSILKENDSYIFTKNHEYRKEVFDDNYLASFMEQNLDINKILD
jgi:hypothetical protein